ncbi:MAG TPA: hypothetical protein VNO21_19465 [Polyangiaceae bacterium]|nr:hypothetical protein [Polyangiaceae bacterium]
MKHRRSLLAMTMTAMLVAFFAACGSAKQQPPLTPDGPESEADGGAPSTLPAPDPHNK